MTIAELLDRILQASSVSPSPAVPDRRPLYGYVASEPQLDELRRLVAVGLSRRESPTKILAAGFCLAAARWLGSLEDRQVTWERLWTEGFGLQPLEVQLREPLLTLGMRYWQRPIVRLSTNRYLSTLYVEGGLATKLLAEPGNPLHAYVLDVLTEHERYPHLSLEGVVRRYEGRVARGYRTDAVHLLVAGIVRAIAEARRSLADPSRASNDQLDLLDESWIPLLPLSLADEGARSLIRQLMTVPRPESEPSLGIEIETSLVDRTETRDDEHRFLIGRRLVGPTTLSADLLVDRADAQVAPVNATKLLLQGEREQITAARLRKQYGRDGYRVDWTAEELLGDDAAGPLRIGLMQADRRCTELEHDGCSALPDGPWYFSDDGSQRYRWLGANSIRVTDRVCLVALPDDASDGKKPAWEGGESPKFVGTLKLRTECRPVYRLRASGSWTTSDDTYQVVLGFDRTIGASYQLLGTESILGFGGSRVWIGRPRVVRKLDDGSPAREVSNTELQWRPDRPGTDWQPLSPACLGAVVLRYHTQGTTFFRRRLVVLPESFMMDYRTRERQVQLRGMAGVSIVAGAAPFEVDVQQVGSLAVVRVELPTEALHEPIPLRLDFGQGRQAEIAVACPVDDIAVLDNLGRRVVFDKALAPIPLGRLETLRLRARYASGARFHLVDDEAPSGIELAERGLRSDGQGGYECPLDLAFDQVAARLAADADADRATLRVSPIGQLGGVKLRVGRSGGKLTCEKQADGSCRLQLNADQRRQPWFAAAPRLTVERIYDPSISAPTDAIDDSSSLEGTWIVRPDLLPAGPWLAT
ncbi:MAG TPA: STY4851/ECs_5259 family protein, partial [Pirellulaceae bacterium]|nr:STY4851/ECs_5259 family protein [Pirellulaceae bacterium]